MDRSSMNHHRGSTSSLVIGVLVLLGLLGLGVYGAWIFLRTESGDSVELTRQSSTTTTGTREEVIPEVQAEPLTAQPPVVENNVPEVTSLSEIPAKRRPTADRPFTDEKVFPFLGQIFDSETKKPVIYFEIFLIPDSEPDIDLAIRQTPSRKFREVDGKFEMTPHPAGTYTMVVRTLTHKENRKSGVTIPQQQPLTMYLDRGAWISGTVRDTYGMPLEGMEVYLHIVAVDEGYVPPQRRIVKSDKTGYFEFSKMVPGRYRLSAGPLSDPNASHEEFRVELDQQLDKSFQIQRRTTLHLSVIRQDGAGIPRARVTMTPEESKATRSEYTDLKGVARVMFLKGGTYRLQVRAPGYQPYDTNFVIPHTDGIRSEEIVLQVIER